MLELIDELSRDAGPLALVVLGFAAALEYVFPPFPGDTVTVFGGLFAVRGGHPFPVVFAVIMVGSLAGAALDYAFGWWLGARLATRRDGFFARRLPLAQLQDWEERFRKSGAIWLVLNRFLPAVRGPVFVAAGMARIRPLKVLMFGTISALAWNALLFGAGYAVGNKADRLEALLSTYGRVAWAVLAGVVLGFLVRWAWRRRNKTQ